MLEIFFFDGGGGGGCGGGGGGSRRFCTSAHHSKTSPRLREQGDAGADTDKLHAYLGLTRARTYCVLCTCSQEPSQEIPPPSLIRPSATLSLTNTTISAASTSTFLTHVNPPSPQQWLEIVRKPSQCCSASASSKPRT